jgi:hypothetical protein
MSSERLFRPPCPTALQHRADRERTDAECIVTGSIHPHFDLDHANSEQRAATTVTEESDGTDVIEWDISHADIIDDVTETTDATDANDTNATRSDEVTDSPPTQPTTIITADLTSPPRRSTRNQSVPNANAFQQSQILEQIRQEKRTVERKAQRTASTPTTPRSRRQTLTVSPHTPRSLTAACPRPPRPSKRTPARVHSITAALEAEPPPLITISNTFSEQELPKLYNAAKVLHMIPQSVIPHWIKTIRAHLIAYKQARASGDAQHITDALWALITVAVRTLRAVRRGSGRFNAIKWIHRRLTAAQQMIESAEYFGSQSQSGGTEVRAVRLNSTREKRDQDDACVAEACRQASMGYLGQSKRALKQTLSVAPAHEAATYSQLLSLHPQSEQVLPPLPEDAVDHLLQKRDMDAFIKHIRKIDNGSASGPSQWSGHMLRVLTTDSTCMEILMDLVNDIINGKIPVAARSFLMSSRLIAIYKDGEQQSVRPIAIGEVFYRLASRTISQEAIPRAQTLLKNQYGVGNKDGTAQVVHQLQTRISDAAKPEAAISLDLRNAFNECSRSHVMQTVYRHRELECLWKMVDFVYSSPTTLWTVGADGSLQSSPSLQSVQGVRQGDPLSPLLFALLWQIVIDEVLQEWSQQHTDDDAHILAFVDDTTIVGSVDTVFQVYDMIVEKARNIGLQVQPAKCAFIYLHAATAPPNAATAARIAENVIPSDDAITVLGVPIGVVADKYKSVLQKRLESTKHVFRRMTHKGLPKQTAAILLRVCVQTQFDYLLRMISPNTIEPYAKQFDSLVQNAVVNTLDIGDVALGGTPQNELAMTQLYLPIAMGGAGYQRVADRRFIAFFASHVGAVTDMSAQWESINRDYRQSYHDMLEVITECIDNTRAQFMASPVGGNDAEIAARAKRLQELDRLLLPWVPDDTNTTVKLSSLLQFYGSGERFITGTSLQTSLTRLAQLNQCYAFRHTSSPLIGQLSDKFRSGYHAHVVSLSSPHTGVWLSVIPRGRRFEMRDTEFVIAARMRLYVQGHKVQLKRCFCQRFHNETGVYVDDPIHGLSCLLTRGRQITARHDMMTDAVATGLRQCGTRVRVEQKGEEQKTNQRPDLFAVVNDIPTLYDGGVVQPSAVSYRGKGPLVRANEYAKEKIAKYADLAMENDARFIPFIVECNGGYGEHALYVLDDLKVFAHEEALAFAPSEVVRDMMDAVAIAIQRGNAMAIRSAWERMMHVRYEQQVVSTAQLERSLHGFETDNNNYNQEPEGDHDGMIRQSSMLQPETATALTIECIG